MENDLSIPDDHEKIIEKFKDLQLNDIHEKVHRRIDRLVKFNTVHAPKEIIENEKRMVQEAVIALLDRIK